MIINILHSDNIPIEDLNYGGKAEGLLFLKKHYFNVPSFFLISYQTIQKFVKNEQLIQQSVDQFIEINKLLPNSLWAVRSSANVEDGKDFSYAGLFKTITNVQTSEMALAIKNVILSYLDVEKLNYGLNKEIDFSIIIQEMVKADYSGVVFSRNPFNERDKSITINIIPGLGENLVSGKEEALIGSFKNGKIKWSNAENLYYGEIFSNGLNPVSKTGKQIIEDNNPTFSSLIKGTKKLKKLLKHEVDIEFAISDNKLYWLQVRPITSKFENKKNWIYDNSNIGENYPGITLPLSTSFVKHTYQRAYRAMSKYFGMKNTTTAQNNLLFDNMVGDIKGGLYYNVTAWQQLLYQLPFGEKTSRYITKLWNMDEAEFEIPERKSTFIDYFKLLAKILWAFIATARHRKLYVNYCNQVLANFASEDLKSKTLPELINLYRKYEQNLGDNWLAPVLNGFYAMILFALLKKVIRKSGFQDEYPNFVNDILYAQGDIISVQIVKDLQNLVTEIQQNNTIQDIFIEYEPETLFNKIEIEFPQFYSKIQKYISDFGDRCDEGELKMETVNYNENPLRLVALLKAMANNLVHKSEANLMTDYKKVINKQYKYRPIRKVLILKLIRLTLNRIRDRENYRFTRTRIFSVTRKIFRAIDSVLLSNQQIDNKGDSLYLKLEEMLDINLIDNCQQIIQLRKAEYQNFDKEVRSNRYQLIGEKMVPIHTGLNHSNAGIIKGIGCCSGIVTNKVIIINPESLKESSLAGNILVAKYFEPGWINLFSQALGIISEKGNLLSHTAILCREMGIPSIIGAKGITTILKTGDIVTMNGATGEIKMIK